MSMAVSVTMVVIVMAVIIVIVNVIVCGACQRHSYLFPQNASPETGLMTPSSAAYR